MKPIILTIAIIALTACGAKQASNPSTPLSKLDAVVSQDQYDRAAIIVSWSRTYIPYDYTADGCYARAFYMAMELAASEIPSSSVFVFPATENGALTSPHGEHWVYHVAMMLQIDRAGTRMIFDPSLDPKPQPQSKWVSQIGGAKTVTVPGSVYMKNVIQDEPDMIIDSFDRLPKFDASDIEQACSTLYNNFSLMGGPNTESNQTRLKIRTRVLFQILSERNKILGDTLQCAGVRI